MTVSQNRLVVGYDNSAFQPISYTAHDAVTRQLTPADTLGKARQRGEVAKAMPARWTNVGKSMPSADAPVQPRPQGGGRHAARTMTPCDERVLVLLRTDTPHR